MEGDHLNTLDSPMTFSKSRVPFFGGLIDYIDESYHYLRTGTFDRAEKLHVKSSKATLSSSFLAGVCLLLGLVCNVKFEVVTTDNEPLPRDLHYMLLSIYDPLYTDDIDLSKVMWCVEASDCLVILISTLLIRKTSSVESPLSEYLYLPWLGATLRGMFMRQAPTAAALIYTMAMVKGQVNSVFITAFTFLFLLEARLWLEIARLVRVRWEQGVRHMEPMGISYAVEPLCNNAVNSLSVEMNNFIYR